MERLRRATSIRPACAIVMILAPHAAVAGAEAGTAVGSGEVEGVVWVLAGYGTAGVTNAPVAGSRIDIAFEDGRVAGSSGCNSYAGTYALDGTALGIGPLASTRKACPPPLMQQEDQYQRILRAVDSATIAGDRLTLSGPAGTLEFVSEGEPSLVGTWEMTGYNNGKQAVVSKKAGTNVTATWAGDGSVAGSSGCNSYSGSYQATGTAITVGQLASTLKMCADPEVMSQEQLYLKALRAATKIELRGNTLRLRDDGGATQVTFRRQGPAAQ